MPMDGFTLSFMARELNEKLAGGRVDKVNQPERDALTLLIRSGGGNHRLLLSANANQARAQLTGQNYENPAEPPMFCMLMRKHLLGARVIRVEQLFGDRILAVRFDALDEMSDHVEKTLYLEVMGRYSDPGRKCPPKGGVLRAVRRLRDLQRFRAVSGRASHGGRPAARPACAHAGQRGAPAGRRRDDRLLRRIGTFAGRMGAGVLSERLRGENARKGVCLSGADGRSDARSFLVDGYALRGTAPRLAAGFPVLLQRPKNIFPFAQAAGTIRPRGRSGMETPSGVSERISGAFIPERIRSTHGISSYTRPV